MKSTFTILFYLRKNRKNENGQVPVMARITINGEMTQFSTKLQIDPDQWEQKMGRGIGRSSEIIQLNRLLDAMRVRATDLYHKYLHEQGYVLPEKIKNILLGIDTDKRKMLLEYFTEHNEFYKLKIGNHTSHTTHMRYELTRQRLQEFIKKENKLSDIPIIELTPLFIEKFFLFLQNEHDCSNNTALKFIQRFRAVFNYIKSTGADIKADPFASFKFKTTKVVREVLTQEEIDIIYKKEFLTERLCQIRDVFIFMCYSGLSYIDVAQLTEDNIKTAFDGHQWVMTKRQKTNVPSNIRLLEIPLEIVERYRGKQKDGKLFPVCSNQKMNEYLKEIATICGITKPITCHVARHTFGSTVTLANGVPIETVSKMLGHTDVRTTQIYARIVDKKLSSDMDSLARVYKTRKTAK
ncbi:site-specific integrase [Dysgonomonas sp. Marseille-P4677]|uniref:site-specific integrase n=1 Tax=Dysgonomonas sp. Marseille-P4677 TaxID=2364790 RepID=UPI0019124862|nr:site-specific integrase [Dysgonomonas sp. Marseille-P4677]MBK5720220.1 site-specific integrase [Dysgonomonas sp. Marseille-P4677]